eukprot:TRINITY_DN1027_c0_g1_i1.p1 TRINITY_DN1027_c0_g1~~TRINITY_DN1027_c0_g1_i1.p1  ORF type:complete len:117 (+),score=26.13 TRINITY_DN1027_c0_g1_i1:163-513(+)
MNKILIFIVLISLVPFIFGEDHDDHDHDHDVPCVCSCCLFAANETTCTGVNVGNFSIDSHDCGTGCTASVCETKYPIECTTDDGGAVTSAICTSAAASLPITISMSAILGFLIYNH